MKSNIFYNRREKNISSANRNNSAIEILRVVLLIFLLFTHMSVILYSDKVKFLDLRIIRFLSIISVDGFALITGIFVYKQKKTLFYRNVTRLLIVIIFSLIISFSIFHIINKEVTLWWFFTILAGGYHSWYLYAIIVIYLFAPVISKVIINVKKSHLLILSIIMILGIILATYKGGVFEQAVFGTTEYSWLFLFPITIIGYVISNKTYKYRKLLFFIFVITWATYSVLFSIYIRNDDLKLKMFVHQNPLTIIGAVGVVGLVYEIKWYSKVANYIVKHLYFIYEYHWVIFLLWRYVYKEQLHTQEHIYIYITIITTLATLLPLSYSITKVQLLFDRKFTPWLEKKGTIAFNKIFKSKKET